MKKLKFIAVIALASIGFTNCDDAIDITQVGILNTDAAFETVADLQLGLLGAYSNFDHTQQIQFNALFTDELSIGIDNGGKGPVDGTSAFVLNAGSAFPTALWVNYNAALNTVNRIIIAADGVDIEAGEQAQFNDILGQLHGHRAYAHFELLSYLSTDYTDDSSLATILLNFTPTTDQQLPRNTNGEIFALIDSDLTIANDLVASQSNPVFISRDFVTALRARIAAYRENYAMANTLATQLLNAHGLADRDEYVNM